MNRKVLQLISLMISSGTKRANWYRKKKLFGHIGNNVMIQGFKLPLNPELVYIGDNVNLASNVTLVTHDVVHYMLNKHEGLDGDFKEKTGKIEIGNNVFVGANSVILYDVKIGNNVIIGANSTVTKDLPEDSVCVGSPCKRIGSFQDFVNKRRNKDGESQ
ncbi:MAG: acyltransferase [Lachnospiraceae bacterium]|nr:acyltransferase [Lachnospiraceae bacterium]